MNLDSEIDAFVRRQQQAGRAFEAISNAPWIESFEAKLPYRLPPSFRSLVSRYRFGPFAIGGIELFGNLGSGARDDLVVASLRDVVLAQVCQRNGFIQIGRPATGAYHPVCFDMSRRSKAGEAPLVCLDHEAILIHERISVVGEHAKSFTELLSSKPPPDAHVCPNCNGTRMAEPAKGFGTEFPCNRCQARGWIAPTPGRES